MSTASFSPFDISAMLPEMVGAAQKALIDRWPRAREFAIKEMKNLAETLAMIGRLRLTGEITEKESELQLRIQKNAALSVLTAIEGISILMAEEAIESALDIVREAVNRFLGFALI